MGNISYTAHVSNKKSDITSKSKLAGVAKHNLRKYKSSDYSKDNIFIVYGTSNLIDDVKTVYHKEFDEALEEYNKKQTRPDRRIEDYFEHVAGKEQDMAVEIIIQIGDREFWKQYDDMKSYIKLSYEIILGEFIKRLPGFVVANAVVHLDEDSPHKVIVKFHSSDETHKIGALSSGERHLLVLLTIFVGSEVHIDMFDDRIEIYSPGGMISGISLEGKIY